MLRVIECFQITGRGVAVLIDGVTELPVMRPLRASVTRSDGSVETFRAHKEWVRRLSPPEVEAFVLIGGNLQDVPVGSQIELQEGG